jgi:transcriptional antiterminator RfaH
MAKLYEYAINGEYKWHAVYTRFNHEKTVESALIEKNIEVFLPKRKILKSWSDRKKWIEEPLFRPYVFVRVSNKEYDFVLQTPSVYHYICINGKAALIQNREIELIKKIVEENLTFDISEKEYELCQKVKVTDGPLKGYTGQVVRQNGCSRLQINISELQYNLIIDIESNCISPF